MPARKTSALPTRIWSFHAEAPTVGAERAREIVRVAGEYYNTLVAIERERVREYEETRRYYAPEIVEAEEAWRDALASTLTGPEKQQRLKGASEFLSSRKREFEASLARPREELKRRRKILGAGKGPSIRAKINAETLEQMLEEPQWGEAWKDLEQAQASALEQIKQARAKCGIPFGCYVLTEMAVQAAIEASRPAPPKPKEQANARLGLQLRNDTTVKSVLSGRCAPLKIAFTGGRGAIVTMVLGRDEEPIEFTIHLHNSPPPNAIVKWAWLRIRSAPPYLSTPYFYEFQLTLEAAEFAHLRWQRGSGLVRLSSCLEPLADGGMRVARWAGEDGRQGEVTAPAELLRRLAYPARLRRYADERRDRAYRVIRLWLWRSGNRVTMRPAHDHGDPRLEPIKALARGYAEHHLGAGHDRGDPRRELWEAWRRERGSLRLDLYADLREASRWAREHGLASAAARFAWWLELWTRKDTHLRRWAADQRRHAENSRDERYREEAIALTRAYGTLETDAAAIAQHDASAATLRELTREYFGLPKSPGKRERSADARKSADPRDTARSAENMLSNESKQPDAASTGKIDAA